MLWTIFVILLIMWLLGFSFAAAQFSRDGLVGW